MKVWGKRVQVDWTQDFVSRTASDEALGIYLMISLSPPWFSTTTPLLKHKVIITKVFGLRVKNKTPSTR
jgi:hypothetical protein